MVQTTLDRSQLPESATIEPPGRRPVRAIIAWGAVALALTVAIVLAAVVLFDDSASVEPGPVFTEHSRLHAFEDSFDQPDQPDEDVNVTTGRVFTEHGLLK